MARHFIGTTTDYLKVGAGFLGSRVPLSIALWMNPTTSAVSEDMIAPSSSGGMSFHKQAAGRLVLSQDAVADIGSSTGSISGGVWTHVGVTWDGTTVKFYISGVLDSSAAGTSFFTAGGSPYTLGRSVPDAKVFTGSLADVACFNSILSVGEFNALAKGVVRPHQLTRRALTLFCPLDGYDHPVKDYSPWDNNPGTVVGTGTTLVSGPPLISPLKIVPPQNVMATTVGGGGGTTVFRRSLSSIGTRVGSRQAVLS